MQQTEPATFAPAETGDAPIVLLNTPVITNPGTYVMENIDTDAARALISECGFTSAIGHTATADTLRELLGVDCQEARIRFSQAIGQRALIFRLNIRLPEGHVLQSREEIEAIGYSLGLLTRIA